MKPIAIFYHCLFVHGTPPTVRPGAIDIVREQMDALKNSGLLDAASFMLVGINGGKESENLANRFLPEKSKKVYHGLKSKAENLTIVELEKWVPDNPGWNVLYFHAKGCTHPPNEPYLLNCSAPWRRGMQGDVVGKWRECVKHLEDGAESVGSHWMTGLCDGTQNIWAGNFWWATSDFLKTVPSIYLRDRIKVSGIADAMSRFEAEVWLGNAPRLPKVVQLHPNGGDGIP